MENYNTIIFDLDGTLINSMDQHYFAWSEILKDEGIVISQIQFNKLEGMNIYELMKRLTKISDEKKIKLMVANKDKIFIENYVFKVNPGVEDLLERIKKLKIQCGIVTASSKFRIEQTIPLTFRNKFSVIITSDDKGPGKPDPWPYIQGLKKLGSNTEKTLVFENAPLGVKSAKAAGLTCIGIGTTVNRLSLKEADYFYSDFDEFNEVSLKE